MPQVTVKQTVGHYSAIGPFLKSRRYFSGDSVSRVEGSPIVREPRRVQGDGARETSKGDPIVNGDLRSARATRNVL